MKVVYTSNAPAAIGPYCLAMTMTLSGGKRTGFKVGSDYYHSVTARR